jgi:peptidoglycan/LPS O-acetylase OafA/YrhL
LLLRIYNPNVTANASATNSSPQGRLPELDGIRGMAILLVLLYHYIYLANPDAGAAPGGLLYEIERCFAMGWAGVDLFFVLSGFLIGGILLDARTSSRYFSTFYARRFYRIIPLYYGWIGIYFALLVMPFHNHFALLSGNPEKWRVLPIYLLFLQNLTKIPHAIFGTAWLGALWSLAVEEQFYLVMPLAVRYLPRRKLVPLLWLAVVGAPIARLAVAHFVPQHPAAQFILTPCRADALAMGVLLAVAWRDERWRARFLQFRSVVYAALILFSIAVVYLALWEPSQYSRAMAAWGFSCVEAFFALLLVMALMKPSGIWGSICRWSLLAELGRVSYCLYVIHAAVDLLCHELLLGATPRFVGWRTCGVTVLAGLIAYGLAKLSWICFEHPLLRRGHAFRYFPQSTV